MSNRKLLALTCGYGIDDHASRPRCTSLDINWVLIFCVLRYSEHGTPPPPILARLLPRIAANFRPNVLKIIRLCWESHTQSAECVRWNPNLSDHSHNSNYH